ncbi:MAG: gliding motility-associated ABC transporter substrate-binding protein GldG [Saprospiraceae bacterium]|nr:gliding motility-associated ABC transporter substrate-binding protein GldG [Saprospiraceae bacterium]
MLQKLYSYLNVLIMLAIVLIINVIAGFLYLTFDLTEDKRYTLSPSTKQLVRTPDDNMVIRILLDGEFPAGFKRLQTAVRDKMLEFRRLNPNIVFEFEDPSSGTPEQITQRRDQLAEDKIFPIVLSYSDGTQVVQKPVYPFAIIYYNKKKFIVNLLEEQLPGDDEDEILNKSVALLEYKFANAFQRILADKPKNVLYLTGHGEWDEASSFRLESEIRKFHRFQRVNPDTLMKLDSTIDLIIVAGPKSPIPLKDQFKLDQYIMQGGKIIWLLDKLEVSMDSISKYKFYIPPDIDYGVDDMLFKYGVRIRPDLVLDLECSTIPQVVGMAGDKPQTRMFSWMYHPVVQSYSDHPIVRNIDRVNMFFPSGIDTLKTDGEVKKTVLLASSRYSRAQLSPVRLSFEILKVQPDPAKFNQGNIPLAVLLEGNFESYFKNRLTPEFQEVLNQLNLPFLESGRPAKQMVVSDAEFMQNLVKVSTGKVEEIGYNAWERKYYKGNKDFILNAVEYMLDEHGVLESRSKEIKLRLLDAVRTKSERTFWQILNIGLPLVFLLLFGVIYRFIRKKKYTTA